MARFLVKKKKRKKEGWRRNTIKECKTVAVECKTSLLWSSLTFQPDIEV